MSAKMVGVGLVAYGLISILFPRIPFYFDEGWKFEGAEPSRLYLFFVRLQGVGAIVVGAIMFVAVSSEASNAQSTDASQVSDPSWSRDTVKNGP